MTKKTTLTLNTPQMTDEEFFERVFSKSESVRSVNTTKTALQSFDHYCQHELGLNGQSMNQMISQYQEWLKPEKVDGERPEPDTQKVCISLEKFIRFCQKNHDEIVINTNATFKAKSPVTIKTYFGMVKTYLRIVHGVKITTEDIKDYVIFPKVRKEARKPISLDTLKTIWNNCDPQRRALYYVLISSGMRLGEGLSLKKSNFHIKEIPIRVSLLADDTKTKEARETYISAEAWERVKPIYDKKGDDEYLFLKFPTIPKGVIGEDRYFGRLRERLLMTERYPKSIRFIVNIHSFRSYFITKASMKHGSDYSHAISGHGAYLKEYIRIPPEERAQKYLTLEPQLLIESVKVQAEKTKDVIIETLEAQMEELQNKMKRIELLNA
jgi:integrase